jgi:hypothetical protein
MYNGELLNFCCVPYVTKVIKSRRTKWLLCVACRGNMGSTYNILVIGYKGNKTFRRSNHLFHVDVKKYGLRA